MVFFLSEYSFAEKICDRQLLQKYSKKTENRALVIIGEIIAAEYDHDVDWSNVPRTQKMRLRKAFIDLLDDFRSNSISKREKLEGFSKVRAFLSPKKYPALFPIDLETKNDDDDDVDYNDKRYFKVFQNFFQSNFKL